MSYDGEQITHTDRNADFNRVVIVLQNLQIIQGDSLERKERKQPKTESWGPTVFRGFIKDKSRTNRPRRSRRRTKTNTLWYYGIPEKTLPKKRAGNVQNRMYLRADYCIG